MVVENAFLLVQKGLSGLLMAKPKSYQKNSVMVWAFA